MSCGAQMRERAAQRAQGVADQTGHAAGCAIQRADSISAPHPFGHAKKVVGGHPFTALRGGIGHGVEGARLSIAADHAVKDQTVVFPIQQDEAGLRIPGLQGADAHGFAIADGGVHAGAARAEGHGGLLVQQLFDDGSDVVHGIPVPRFGKVAQAMGNTSLVLHMGRRILLAGAVGSLLVLPVRAAMDTGEAVVAAMTGNAEVRVFTGPVHEGRTRVKDLSEGAAVGESSRAMTGKDGRLCMVFSPGAIICVAPRTEFTIRQLRHTADGLPQSEEDLVRRIHLDLHKGRIRVQAGVPTPSLDIRITTPVGMVEAQGGSFVVAQGDQGRWNVLTESYELAVTPRNGNRAELKAGEAAWMAADGEDRGELRLVQAAENPELYQFELCNAFFQDLEPFINRTEGFDREGLGQYLGLNEPFLSLDSGAAVTDASPSIRPSVSDTRPADLPRPGEGGPGARWDDQRIWNWYNSLGTVKGVNYIPRTAVNSVEMWMEDTFDPDTIDEELGWAHDIGYTSIRVQLQFAVWKDDPDGFLKRMDKLLEIAASHGLRVVPVLFDDLNLAGQAPQVGMQPGPVSGEYNARWVPSPAPEAVKDRSQWPELEKYVKDVMDQFKRDARVIYWDLYNTAGNGGLWEETLPLMDQTFNWAREIDPAQPLAVAAWKEFGSAMAARKLERSDLVTFQSFDSVEGVEARLLLLQRYKRPIICSDWLMRQTGNDFEKVLPVFATYRVGWFNRGLVAGKTQMQLQQAQYRSEQAPDLWQQDVLHEDGTPYNEKELELIQGFRYLDAP